MEQGNEQVRIKREIKMTIQRKIYCSVRRAAMAIGLALAVGLLGLSHVIPSVCAKDKEKPTGDWKPRIHFYAGPLWNNDPNGPIFLDGQYQLFYQNNPAGDEWGNMSWGHTVSKDLIHWAKLPVALPAAFGVTNFNGTVVEDPHNTSGLCGEIVKPGAHCLVAVYTGDSKSIQGQARQNQNLAFSLDDGLTWTHYAKNPVIDLMMASFRDPKVFWYEPSQSWIMVVMFSDLHTVQMFRSKDLKHWKTISSFGPAGATGGAWECPDLMNLDVRDAQGKRVGSHWVLSVNLNPGGVAGGSGNQYFLGQFDGTRFVEDHPKSPKLWVDWGKDFYASTSFANTPADEDRIWLAWMNNWSYAAASPSLPGRGEMTLARRLYLRQEEVKGSAQALVLVQEPILPAVEVRPASGALTVEQANALFSQGGPESGVYVIRTKLALGAASDAGVRIRRSSLKPDEASSEETVVGIDRAKGQIFVDRTRSGYVSFSPQFPARTVAPLKHPDATSISLEIVVDRNSVEVFAEDGETVLTNLIFPSDASLGLAFYSTGVPAGGAATTLTNLEVSPLK
jgi:fructan beta-fructosidase